MARRVCGTCRFLRATEPNAKSGWCGHPQKQTTTDVRILVRAGELNCRNDWDSDLWQLREEGDRVLDVTMLKAADPGNPSDRSKRDDRPRPLGQDDVHRASPVAPIEDVVLVDDDVPRLVSEDLNRELLRKAREQYRARRLTTRPGGPSPRSSDDGSATLHGQEPIVISNDVLPLPIGQPASPDLSRMSRSERESSATLPAPQGSGAAFSSIPDIEEHVELPRPTQDRSSVIPVVDDYLMETLRHHDEVIETRRSGQQLPVKLDRPDSTSRQPVRERPEQPERRHLEDNPVRERTEDTGERRATTHLDVDEPSRDAKPATSSRRVLIEQDLEHEPEQETVVVRPAQLEPDRAYDPDDIRPWNYVEPRRPRTGDIDTREVTRAATTSSSRLWDDIPRCCRTCRDFRPAETGGRGWCTNRWAFRHRRMVDVDELPCETTIGAWWLPTDDAWQDDPDIGRHVQATPLMDRWIGRIEEEHEPRYPAVASRTRRRP